jgi:uroporphyrinogen decarboxylase
MRQTGIRGTDQVIGRERVLATLDHREPDRVPFDLGATRATGIHVQAYLGLVERLALPARSVTIVDLAQQLALVDDDVSAALRIDTAGVSPAAGAHWRADIRVSDGYQYFHDEFGAGRRMPVDGGLYYDYFDHPLAGDISVRDVAAFGWPDPGDDARYIHLAAATDAAHEKGRAAVVNSICSGLVEVYPKVRGHAEFYMDIASDHQVAEAIMDKTLELKLAYWRRVFDVLGDRVDVAYESDDLGGQHGLLISPEAYRALVKPRHRVLFDYIHSRGQSRILFHSCGAIRPIVGDLIESGVDALNPIQVSAAGMDSRELKNEFGDDVAFWGGGIDTQRVLSQGSAGEVREEVRRRLDDLMPGGGFVFSAVHNIQADVPAENIVTMWETLQEWGSYH